MFKRIFNDHPASVDETYFEHLLFAMKFAGALFLAAGAAIIHALIPCLCEKTASTIIDRLHQRMHRRHRVSQCESAILPAE